jgi:hypothetical protein
VTTSYQKHPLPWQGNVQRLVLAHKIIVREMQADSRPVVLKLRKGHLNGSQRSHFARKAAAGLIVDSGVELEKAPWRL